MFLSIFLSSFDFHEKNFLWSDLLHDYQFFCKVSLNIYQIHIYRIGLFLDVRNPAHVF